MELTGSEERRPGRLHAFAWDLAAASLIPLAAFGNFLSHRAYDFSRPEVLLACGIIVSIAAVVAIVVALRPGSLRPLLLMALVVVFVYMETKFFLPSWLEAQLTSLVGPEKLPNMSAIVYVLPIAVVFWMLGERLSVVLVAVFGTMAVASLVLPQASLEAVSIAERSPPAVTVAGERPPPLIHIIIDQQIGIDGLPAEVEGTAAMRRFLLEFYDRFGFRLYTGAYSHFPATLESIPDLLNGAIVPSSHQLTSLRAGKAHVKTNLWFEELKNRGYEIEVIQSDYIDYCQNKEDAIVYCYTYMASDIRELYNLDLTNWRKAEFLLYRFFDKDFILLSQTTRLAWYVLQKLGKKAGVMLPDWDARSLGLSTLPSLVALDVLAERLENLEAGKAVFVHLLLPHDPFILDANCQLKSDGSLWLAPQSALWWYQIKADPRRRLARYYEYYKQVTCLHRRLSGIFERLEQRGKLDDATVMIHGDHGSRITIIEPFTGNERLLTPGDIIDSVSTIFAVRRPGVVPGPVEGQLSIQGLFAEFALGRDDISDHNDIFLRAPRLGIGPGQTRLPMVPFRERQ
jgi:hypothetical protein